MSARLAMRVLESALPVSLKPIATTMALFGNEAGERIYPSVDRLAFLLGLSRRTVERHLAELREARILLPQTGLAGGRLPGGRGRSVLYRFDAEALPARQPFKPRRQCQGSHNGNPDASVRVQGNPDVDDGVQPDTPTPAKSTPTPLTRTPSLATKNPDTGVGRSYRSDLREDLGEREELPREDRAASLCQEKSQEEDSSTRHFEHHCQECDWKGDLRDSVQHYHKTRHDLKVVEVQHV